MPQGVNRRAFLKSAGAGSAVLLAGCTQGGGDGGGSPTEANGGESPTETTQGTTVGGGDETLKFGVLVPFSGDLAAYGEFESSAVEAAIREVNDNGGVNGKEVEVLIQDTKDQPQTALAGLETLLGNDIFAMYGPFSNTIPAIIEDIGEADIIDFSSAGVASLNDREVDNVFRVMSTDADAFRAEITYIAENYNTIATAHLNNQNHSQAMALIQNGIPHTDVEILESVVMEPGADSFRSSIRKLRDANADLVVAFVGSEKGPLFIRQYREMGVESDVMMSNDIVPIDLEKAGPERMAGVYGARPGTGPAYEEFLGLYEKQTGKEEPVPFGHVAWDSATVGCLAAQAADELTRETLVDEVRNVAMEPGTVVEASFGQGKEELNAGNEINYEGGVSSCEFNEWGDATQPIQIVQVQDGEWVTIATIGDDDMIVSKEQVMG